MNPTDIISVVDFIHSSNPATRVDGGLFSNIALFLIMLAISYKLYKFMGKTVKFYVCLFILIPVVYVSILLAANSRHILCYKMEGEMTFSEEESIIDPSNANCVVKYKDGGKNCKSNEDCLGDCVKIPNNNEYGQCSYITTYHYRDYFIIQLKNGDGSYPCSKEGDGSDCMRLFNKSDEWKHIVDIK